MTAAILPPDRLRICTRALAGEDKGGEPVDRQAIEPLLASALIGPVACDEYLAALAAAFGGRDVPPGALVTEFPVEAVLLDGLGGLSDEQLARLGRSEAAVRELNRMVDEALANGTAGLYWQKAELLPHESIPSEYHIAAERAVADVRLLDRETQPVPMSATDSASVLEKRHRRWVRLALPLALAASLLLAFYLGTRWPGDRDVRDVRLASVTVRGDVTRGIEDIALDVTNGTDRRAFLTVVGLIPGRPKPGYYYRHQEKYLELPPGGTTEVKNLPPVDLGGSTVLLLVTTDVPAGEAVRNVTPQTVTPETADQTADHIRRALGDLNIRADVRVVPLPPPKR